MNRIIIALAALLLSFSVDIAAIAQITATPAFKERLAEREKVEKETLKEIKKLHKAKEVTIERWTDDSVYYVLRDAKKMVAIIPDGQNEPILFKAPLSHPKGITVNDQNYVLDVQPVYFHGKRFYLARTYDPVKVPGLWGDDGSTLVAPTYYSDINCEIIDGNWVFLGSGNMKGVGYRFMFSDKGKLIGSSVGNNIRYVPAREPGMDTVLYNGTKVAQYSPGRNTAFLIFGLKNNQSQILPVTPGWTKQAYSGNYFVLPGDNYLVKSSTMGLDENGLSVRSEVRSLPDGTTGMYQVVDLVDKGNNINKMCLYDMNLNHIVDSVVRITLSAPEQVAYYVRYDPKPHFMHNKGAVSLMDNTLIVQPLFRDVWVLPDESNPFRAYVKSSTFEAPQEFDSKTQYTTNFGDSTVYWFEREYRKGALVNIKDKSTYVGVAKLNKIPVDSLTPAQIGMIVEINRSSADFYLLLNKDILDKYAAGKDPGWTVKQLSSGRLQYQTFGESLERKLPRLEEIAAAVKDEETKAAINASINYIKSAVAQVNYEAEYEIPQAAAAMQARKEAEQARAQAEYLARVEAQRRAQEEYNERVAAAMANAICGTLSAIFSGGSSGYRANSAASYSRPASGSVKSASSGSSSSGRDLSGERNRLQREIIDWKAKLKKATESYERQLASMSDKPDREAKRVLDSKLNTMNQYAAELARCESELRSLK